MGLWQRFKRLLTSNLNAFVAKAEDTEKILEQTVLDMQAQLQKARDEVASAIADEKSLWKQWTEEVKQSEAWEKKAIRAVQLGDDGLAKEALAQKSHHDQVGGELKTQWDAQKLAVDRLKESLQSLAHKIEEAQRKKTLLLARKKRAEAQATIQSTLSSLTDHSAFETFDRMAARVDRMEIEVAAHAELQADLKGATLEQRFRALEKGADAQDDALAALKAKLGLAPPLEPLALPTASASKTDAPVLDPSSASASPLPKPPPSDLQIEVERIRERVTFSRD